MVWFDETVRYGFIRREAGKDIFVHFTGINGRGYKTLKKGQRVSFLVRDDPKHGLQAVGVNVIDEAETFVQHRRKNPDSPSAASPQFAA